MKVALEQRWQGFVDDAVNAGRFSSADAVIKAGLELLERQEAMRRDVRVKLEAAIAKGGEVDDGELDRALAAKAAELRQRGIAD